MKESAEEMQIANPNTAIAKQKYKPG